MKRRVHIGLAVFLGVMLLSSVGLAACAEPTPAPTIEPTETPTETPATTPEVIKLKYATPFLPAELPPLVAYYFCDLIEQKTGGRVKIDRYPGGQLGKPLEHFDLVKTGAVDICTFFPFGFGPEIPMDDFPRDFPMQSGVVGGTREDRLLAQSYIKLLRHDIPETARLFEEETQKSGVRAFDPISLGSRGILTKHRATSLADMQGKKINAFGPTAGMWKELGFIPVSVIHPDVYEGLSRGLIDVAGTAPTAGGVLKWYEPAKSYLGCQMSTWGLSVHINLAVYESLPPDVQQAIEEANEEYTLFSIDLEMQMEEETFRTFREVGLDPIAVFPEEDLQMFVDAWIKHTLHKGWLEGDVVRAGLRDRPEIELMAEMVEQMMRGTYEVQ